MNHKELLKFQTELGADVALEDAPVNHQAAKPKAVAESPAPAKSVPAAVTPQADVPAAEEARKLADAATTLDELREAVMNFDGCALKKTATNTVFSDGTSGADIMFIGEAPGANEDAEGIPFCGQSGQLLDLMLSYVDIKRSTNMYITNTIFWRPPGNRKPTPEEVAICRPFVEKHVAFD